MGQREVWDAQAEAFDHEPDHGLTDPATRGAWRDLLLGALAQAPGRVADLGCGTGTLALLLAEEGYTVDGVDLSPEMVARARAKTAGQAVTVEVGDAAAPRLERSSYDAVLCRHVLWALPDPVDALRRWTRLLLPGGRLVLIEGRWSTGGGMTANEVCASLAALGRGARVQELADPVYWGKPIVDERYLVVSR